MTCDQATGRISRCGEESRYSLGHDGQGSIDLDRPANARLDVRCA